MSEKKAEIFNLRVTPTLNGFIKQLSPELRREMNEGIMNVIITTVHKGQFEKMKLTYLGDDE